VCGLLTPAKIGTIIGESVATATPGGVDCAFAGAGNDVVNIPLAGLGIDSSTYQSQFESFKSTGDMDVSGLGDSADQHLNSDPNNLALYVRKGSGVLGVDVYTGRGLAANLQCAEQIAQLALGTRPQEGSFTLQSSALVCVVAP
jgi:hypothetical protein